MVGSGPALGSDLNGFVPERGQILVLRVPGMQLDWGFGHDSVLDLNFGFVLGVTVDSVVELEEGPE